MTTFGLLIFDGAEELDVVGPWEVFTASAMIQAGASAAANTCVTVAE
jgi:putative intracellular protease/amidase